MISKVTTNFIILRKVTDKNGNNPIRLVVSYLKTKKRYGIGISMSASDWDRINAKRLKNDNLKQIKIELEAIRNYASDIIDQINPFSFKEFEKYFFKKESSVNQQPNQPDLKQIFDSYITKLKNNGQVGTAISYQTTINSIAAFRADMEIADVTHAFLNDYEKHMLNQKKSPSTIGIYLRQLRAVINQAIRDNHLSRDQYPFTNYKIPRAKNTKKALKENDLAKLLNYRSVNTLEQKAIDFWTLSYLCNGMNFTDIAHLKPESIDGEYLFFNRQKTMRTKKSDQTPIRLALLPRTKEIIEKYKNTDDANPYLFPILAAGITPLNAKYRIQHFIRMVNDNMKAICIKLEINQPVGTYSARHSFATLLKQKGVPTSYIKEALGHSSEATTESYLSSFSDDTKMDYAKLLTDISPVITQLRDDETNPKETAHE